MSSFVRRLQRRALRKASDYEVAAQPTAVRKDGSYKTLRPTLGWLEICAARIAAQMKLAEILSRDIPRVSTRKLAKVWRKPMPVVPGTVTRQQRRAALRAA